MKKLLAVALLSAIAVTFVFANAATESAAPAAQDGTKTITVVTWDASTTPYLIAQKEAFEASHPGVKIEYIDVASQDYGTKTTTMLAGGDTSDVYMVKEITDNQKWHEAGYSEALDSYMKGFDVSGFAGIHTNYAIDGKQYALPFRSDFWVLFYNKDIFDAAGVAYPTNDMTWEQYADLAVRLTDSKKGVYGAHYHTWLSAVVNWTVADGKNTLIDGNYDDLAYFYNLYQKLEDKKACMAYSELKASGLHYSAAFGNGNVAMMPMGYWYVSTLISKIKSGEYNVKNWGIVAVPHKSDVAAGSSFGNLTGVMMNAKSKQKDLAWQYISWLCGEEGAQATAATGTRPCWASDSVASVMSAVDGYPTDENSKKALVPVFVGVEIPASAHSSEISKILNEEHTLIMTRECKVSEGIAEMNERVADVLK